MTQRLTSALWDHTMGFGNEVDPSFRNQSVIVLPVETRDRADPKSVILMMAHQGQTSLQDSSQIRHSNHCAGRDLQNAACRKKESQGGPRLAITPKQLQRASEAWARHRSVSILTPSFSAGEQWRLVSSSARLGTPKTRLAIFQLQP